MLTLGDLRSLGVVCRSSLVDRNLGIPLRLLSLLTSLYSTLPYFTYQSLRAFRRAQKSSKMRFLMILKIFKKLSFLMVLDLGTSLELNFMQFRIEPTNRHSIS